jgi:hypothetical protein
MSELMTLLSQHIGSEQIAQIAGKLGASSEQTENAIGMALPTLLGAVARKADDDQGVQELHQSLEQNDGSILDQLGSLFGGGAASAPSNVQAFGGAGDILGSILGGRQGKVEQGIGKASGLSAGQVASLLGMLAPMVLGAIGKKSRSAQMDAGGLGEMLRTEKKSMENQASGGLLAGLLDQDGDGDFDFQDVMKLGMKRLFGR